MLEIRLCAAFALVALVAACGRQQGEAPAKEHTRLEGEIALALGDCAPPSTRFVSGPEPQAFDEVRPATSLYATMSPGGDVAAGFDAPANRDAAAVTDKLAASAPDKLAAHDKVSPASITDKLAAHETIASAHYLPGASSPLASLRLALIDCFREQDRLMGVAVFDLAPGSITARGIDNATFTKCVGELASQVSVKEPVRCAAAFGAALLPELPHIDIKEAGVFVDGKRVEIKDTDAWWKIEPIFTWSTDRVRTTLTSSAPIVLHGPVIVRPAPTTEMKLVTKLLHTLIAAGDDPMLAADRDGTWLALHPRNLPVIPVPLGTGGSWNSDKAKLDVPRISILVGKQQLWIDGVAVTDEKTELAAAQLRGAVEIAAQGQVPYSRVVEVIDELGGIDWSLTAGRALAKPPNREQPHIERTTRHDVRGAPISK
jgi:hypothetical protein